MLDHINILSLCRSIPANSHSHGAFFPCMFGRVFKMWSAHFTCENYLIPGMNIGSYREDFGFPLRWLGRQLVQKDCKLKSQLACFWIIYVVWILAENLQEVGWKPARGMSLVLNPQELFFFLYTVPKIYSRNVLCHVQELEAEEWYLGGPRYMGEDLLFDFPPWACLLVPWSL